MLTITILFTLILPIALGSSVVTLLMSPDELKQMGVNLENSHA